MNASPLWSFWFPLLALLAAEVGIIAALVAAAQGLSPSAGWRRTFCQAGLVAVLVLSVGELSGAARQAAGRLRGNDGTLRAPALLPEGGVPRQAGAPSLGGGGEVPRPPRPSALSRRLSAGATPAGPSGIGAPGSAGHGRSVSAGAGAQAGAKPARAGAPGAVAEYAPGELPAGFWLVLIWGTGALAVGGRACLAHCALVLFRLRRRQAAERAVVERMAQLARALGLRRRVRVMISGRLAGPIAFGWIWPTLALPAGFAARLDRAKQEAVLLHELAHVAAHDSAWGLLADAAAAVWWWHPAVWWLRRQSQLASELAADEASLLVADGPRALAECLVQFGARLLQRPIAGQIPVAGFRSHLGRRVQRLMRLEGGRWSPPRRLPAALARSIGAAAAAAAVVVCSAWAAPREFVKGDTMKNIQQNWRQSLAAFAFLAAVNGPDALAREVQSQPAAPAPAAAAPASTNTTSAALLSDQGRFDPAAPPGRTNAREAAMRRYLRYGARAAPMPAARARASAAAQKVEAKLEAIVLDKVEPMENRPLSEVIKWLATWALQKDPEGTGVNFLIDFKSGANLAAGEQMVDPATGLPRPTPVEAIDLSSIGFRIPLPLHKVTLREMLEVLLKAADRPIQYAVEDYGVVFSARPPGSAEQPKPAATPAPERLVTRAFRLDTNTVADSIEETFHIGASEANVRSPHAIETALKTLVVTLCATSDLHSVFYNGRTGVVMVRASREDMEAISAAMETLTGMMGTNDSRAKETRTAPAATNEVRIFALRNCDAKELADQIRQLELRPGGEALHLAVDAGANSVIVSAAPQDVQVISNLIQHLDVGADRAAASGSGANAPQSNKKRILGKIYVSGQVRQSGPLEISDDEVFTVSKAILKAGGFSDFADKRHVALIREGAQGGGSGQKPQVINVQDIWEKGKTENDVPVQADDIILVPKKTVNF